MSYPITICIQGVKIMLRGTRVMIGEEVKLYNDVVDILRRSVH